MKIVISSGHGSKVEGAVGILNEVEEARRVVDRTALALRLAGVEVVTFHDDESRSPDDNLECICDFHNAQGLHDLDVSVHFNSYTSSSANGTECWYFSQPDLANRVSEAISLAGGFLDRGPKYTDDFYFLNHTVAPAILIEVCFVTSPVDADLYRRNFDDICEAIAGALEDDEDEAALPPSFPVRPLTHKEIDAICAIARGSEIALYNWQDRGVAPAGYIQGMALAFANCHRKLMRGNYPSLDMTQPAPASENDALVVYADEFAKLDMVNGTHIARLRHLFALMIGHGMRESSGRHCEGRDMSANNVSADTAEAGLFQTSWNANTCTDSFGQVFKEYSDGRAQDFLAQFEVGVSCSDSEWSCYGSGDGYEFQKLCKEAPAFAVETAALTLRHRCNHYGPIMRGEVELRPEANEMLREVERYLNRGGA